MPSAWLPSLEIVPREASRPMLVSGWAKPEKVERRRYFWSSGPRSTIHFPLDRVAPLELEMRCWPFEAAGRGAQQLEVVVNGASLARLELPLGHSEHRIRIPPETLRAGSNELRFDYAWTAVPKQVIPGSLDERELAVGFERIALHAGGGRAEPVQVRSSRAAETLPALQLDAPGSVSYLVVVPEAARLRVGGAVLPGETGGSSAAAELVLESDEGPVVLAEYALDAAAGARWNELDLGPWAGRAVRLRFSLSHLAEGARWLWLAPGLEAAAPAASPALAESERWNLVLVVLDAASPRRFGAYGGPPDTTPRIDALATESVVFDAAYSHAAYTLASTASLFTSLLPAEHGAVLKSDRLSGDLTTLAEVLREAGYATAAFSANAFASREFGMEQGFETFEELYRTAPDGIVRASGFREPLRRWLAERPAERPFFLYLHYVQPHEPYDVAPPEFYAGLDGTGEGGIDGSVASLIPVFRGERTPDEREVARIRALYDGNLRYADHEVGALREMLEQSGDWDRTLFVVTSDHGEGLGERGFFGHNASVEDEVVAIPLVMHFPPALGWRGHVAPPVESSDIAPTLLAAVGAPAPEAFRGENLLPLIRGGSRARGRVLFARTHHDTPGVRVDLSGVRYLRAPPGDRDSYRSPDAPEGVEARLRHPVTFAFLEAAADRLSRHGAAAASPRETPLSPESEQALRALGYVVDGAGRGDSVE